MPSVSAVSPPLVTTYVRLSVSPATPRLPKSVWSETDGVASPSAMSTPFPLTPISAASVVTVAVTESGLTHEPAPAARTRK